jgi:glucokinase
MIQPYAIGVDIGGSHISCSAVHIKEGRLVKATQARAEYHHEASADQIFQSWAKALNETLSYIQPDELAGIGFAIPGPFDYARGISEMHHKFKNLYGLHIPTHLQPLLKSDKPVPMRFLNDASAFTVGEAWLGEGKSYRSVVAITLGTGFGSAFTLDGVPVVSGPSVPKEGCLWHLPFLDGVADDYISTRWFVNTYAAHTGETVSGVRELIERVEQDPYVQKLFDTFGKNLASCLSGPLKQFQAEVLIIGGNIAHSFQHFRGTLEQGLQEAQVTTHVRLSQLKENAALIGSARLLDDSFWQKVSAELPEI